VDEGDGEGNTVEEAIRCAVEVGIGETVEAIRGGGAEGTVSLTFLSDLPQAARNPPIIDKPASLMKFLRPGIYFFIRD
jgi:hypothetical protein